KPSPGQERRLAEDAAALRSVLDPESWDQGGGQKGCGPVLVALCGLPGTGKSYFARELVKRTHMLVLESDRLRKILVAKPKYTPGEHRRVFRACYLLIDEYLGQGKRVLFDATNLTEDFRQPIYHIADKHEARLVMVGFTAPQSVVRERLADRVLGRDPIGYSDATWRIHSRMRPFEEPIRRAHLLVDSSKDITDSLDRVVAQITSGDSPSGP
ncbi:MAG: ATP-binding protein, partial [Chloroflexi bacterium]|nr:ATP-binding protein [Chloroflexota bacterium]